MNLNDAAYCDAHLLTSMGSGAVVLLSSVSLYLSTCLSCLYPDF